METSLQDTHLADALHASLAVNQEVEEEEHHIHMPGPSLWPFILSAAVLVTVIGLLFVPETPWLTVIGAPFVLVGILGWALEDPMASPHTQEAAHTQWPVNMTTQEVLSEARAKADEVVTVASTAYSAHPVKVEMEGENEQGAILALHGKVELEAQRENLEATLRQMPGVADVRNYLVAEDTILQKANARIEELRSKGKLEGATNLSILVENYILSLYGEVPNKEMKYALEREMIAIPGVRVVVNHIGLNEDIPGNLGRTLNKVGGV
ncbi:MAG TPA: BON domain-containing protein [Ktedonosporobacter sp.]|nr:BON domain-containing protein [Ktedonosporobacter sp.]